jgi:predicted RNA polymerase sigma factor
VFWSMITCPTNQPVATGRLMSGLIATAMNLMLADASAAETTDWSQIVQRYDLLLQLARRKHGRRVGAGGARR